MPPNNEASYCHRQKSSHAYKPDRVEINRAGFFHFGLDKPGGGGAPPRRNSFGGNNLRRMVSAEPAGSYTFIHSQPVTASEKWGGRPPST